MRFHKPLRLFANLAIVGLLSLPASAQLINIGLYPTAVPDSFEVRMNLSASWTGGTQGVLNGQFTLRWNDAAGGEVTNLASDCSRYSLTPNPLGMVTNPPGGTGFRYYNFQINGINPLEGTTLPATTPCPLTTTPAVVGWIKLSNFTGCASVNIVNDSYTLAANQNYYAFLIDPRTGSILSTPTSGGPCSVDCLGVNGGTALPGTPCNDNNACTVNDVYTGTAPNCGCSGTPIAGPSITASGSNSPICAGSTLNLTASATGTGTISYSWAGPNSFSSLSQNPSISSATVVATGTYTVTASNGCGTNATQTVSVVVNTAPNAGTNGTRTICAGSTVTTAQLLASLGGTPNAGGIWSPTPAGAGTYTYTVAAVAPCTGSATAQVVVTAQPAPNAGSDGAISICAGTTVTALQLFDALNGTPNAGGVWSPTLAGAGVYTYTINAVAPCTGTATAQVTVTTGSGANAGTNGALTICTGTTVTAALLFDALNGTPNTGGTWSPAFAGVGTYTYTVVAVAPCTGSATAQVVVTALPAPNAGTNGTLTICAGSTVTAAQLFAQLGGTPNAGGVWSPALVGAGTYTYTIAAVAPCTGSATAQVVVTAQPAPNAGTSGILTICAGSTVTAAQLFAQLGGNPNAGGVWSPALAGAGTYTYTVAAVAPCTGSATAQVVVTAQPAPNAGSNGTLTICAGSTVTAAQLFAQLGGTPSAGGVWSPTPAGAGTYTYTVAAVAPCTGSATAQVVVTAQPTPNAGSNGAISICTGTNLTAADLFAALGGTPNPGGVWSPSLAGAGTYTYTVTAVAPCTGAATAQVVVTTGSGADAGTSGTLTICAGTTVTAAQLFAALNGTPNTGGTWSPAFAGAGTYTYTVVAVAPCTGTATAQVVVTTRPVANAGTNGSLTICAGSTVSAAQLFAALSGTPNAGGVWSPALAGAGTYTYTVAAVTPCTVDATAQVVVSEQAAPSAGSNGTLSICSTAAAQSLFAQLGGTPDAGGVWTGPSPVVGGLYDPSTMNPGVYTYTVAATAPCTGAATATVTVTETATGTWYQDSDADGAGDPNVVLDQCDQPVGYVANNNDLCPADGNKIAPGACGCGVADVAATYYADVDGDLFGDPAAPVAGFACIVPTGTVQNSLDNCPTTPGLISSTCNDNNPNTGNDVVGADCVCAGQVIDCLGLPGGAALPGTACNDQNVLTENDTWTAGCACVGTPVGLDCAGVPNGTASVDQCGVCSGGTTGLIPNSSCTDCFGVVNGTAAIDQCNVCSGGTTGLVPNASCTDCFGVVNGTAAIDQCNVCSGGTTGLIPNASCTDCLGVVNGAALPGTPCNDQNALTENDTWTAGCACVGTPVGLDCAGVPNGTASVDQCGVCSGGTTGLIPNASCTDCFGVINGTASIDQCGECTGGTTGLVPNASCSDCLNVPNGTALPGTNCDDDDITTSNDKWTSDCECVGTPIGVDCAGVPNGSASIDLCGVCSGGTTNVIPNSTCRDCNDEINGTAGVDECGVCTGGTTGLIPNATCADCAGVPNGTASIDQCNVCSGGITNIIPNSSCTDCAGVVNGSAAIDLCDVCSGGNTGLVPNASCLDCEGVPNGSAIVGSSCDDGNLLTTNDLWLAGCVCQGTPIGNCTEVIAVEFETDASPAQTGWEIIPEGGGAVLCSGAGSYGANTTISETCCLPQGCYAFRMIDSAGDGIAGGGYIIREQSSDLRIIDNRDNFTTGGQSAIFGQQGFCFPLGTDRLIASSCDKLDWIATNYVVASENTAVSATWVPGGVNAVQPANSGYEFWIFDPNGSYSFRRFRSHNVSDGRSPANAVRACHMKVNGWSNTVSTPHIPAGVLMNIRVRSRVNGTNAAFGPACRFKFDPARAACPLTKLLSGTGSTNSCGVTRSFSNGNFVYAQPPQFTPAVAASLLRYQFRFRSAGFEVVRQSNTYILPLNWTNAPALQCGVTYTVDVRVSKDLGATWCIDTPNPTQPFTPWGEVCTLTIAPCAALSAVQSTNTDQSTLVMYPNPNRGDQLFVSMTHVGNEIRTVTVEIFDLSGKRINTRSLAAQDGIVNTSIDLNNDLAQGMYLVNITAGDKKFVERLVIQ